VTDQPPDEGPSGWPSKQTIRRVAAIWILVAAAAVAFALKFGPHGARAIDVPASSPNAASAEAAEHARSHAGADTAEPSAATSASTSPASDASVKPPR